MQTRQRSKQLQCGICFESVTFRGKINHCDHLFCYDCIERWAKVTTDPLRRKTPVLCANDASLTFVQSRLDPFTVIEHAS